MSGKKLILKFEFCFKSIISLFFPFEKDPKLFVIVSNPSLFKVLSKGKNSPNGTKLTLYSCLTNLDYDQILKMS